MTYPVRYPPQPFDWDSQMKLIEDRLDDHLTDEEVAERLATLDRMAERGAASINVRSWETETPMVCADALGVSGAEDVAKEGFGKAALGAIGAFTIAVCVVGIAWAVL